MSVHHPLPLRKRAAGPRLLRTRAWLSLLLYPADLRHRLRGR